MKKQLFCIFLLIISFFTIMGQENRTAYQKTEFKDSTGILPYRLLLPNNYNPSKAYPLVIFLHGSGERGNDNEAQLTHGANLFLDQKVREKYPAIIVFPQCSKDSYWSNVDRRQEQDSFIFTFSHDGEPTKAMTLLQGLVTKLMIIYSVNEKRVYVGGLSMGGMGAFELVRRSPGLFSAAFAICGGAHPDTASEVAGIPWWIFHGDSDAVVDYGHSEKMVEALKSAGAEVKFTTYEGVNHNSWENAFAEPELLSWLFSQSK
ncbi:MAG: PHB depolymerase family esterase [Flavobacteriaceae bacterium]